MFPLFATTSLTSLPRPPPQIIGSLYGWAAGEAHLSPSSSAAVFTHLVTIFRMQALNLARQTQPWALG